MQGPTVWRETIEQLTALHKRCSLDGIAIIVGIVSGLPADRTETSADEFRSILVRNLGVRPQVVVTLSAVPTETEVRNSRLRPSAC